MVLDKPLKSAKKLMTKLHLQNFRKKIQFKTLIQLTIQRPSGANTADPDETALFGAKSRVNTQHVAENCPSFQVFVYLHTSCEQKAKIGGNLQACQSPQWSPRL